MPRPRSLLALAAGVAVLTGGRTAGAVPPGDVAGPPDTLTVVTLNLWHDQRDWPAREALVVRGLAALRPDVLLLQEVLQHEALPNQAEALARALGMPHVHFVSTDPPGAARRYGNAIVSRHPFEATEARLLRPLDQYRTAAFARIAVGGRSVRLYTTHLHHLPDAEGGGIRTMQLRDVLDLVDSTAADAPLVFGGDLNAEPDWPELRLLAPWRDLFAHFHPGAEGTTWGVVYDQTWPRRIDYLFDAADARLVPVEAGRALDVPDAEGRYPSDHFAVYARFLVR